jgi:hypothetical protein
MERRMFEIPDNSEVMAQLIEAVPSNWSWVDGRLEAPSQLIHDNKVALNSGFALQRFHSIHPTIVGKKKDEEIINPDFYSLIVERKLPEFITFDEAAFETSYEGLTMEVIKSIAAAYVRCNYRGVLYFYSGYRHNYKYDNPARCSIKLFRWSPTPFMRDEYPLEEYPPTVEIKWDRILGGEEKDVQPILSVCKRLDLQELKRVVISKEPTV